MDIKACYEEVRDALDPEGAAFDNEPGAAPDFQQAEKQPLEASGPAAGEGTVRFTMEMRESHHKELARLASDADMTIREFVLSALSDRGLSVADEPGEASLPQRAEQQDKAVQSTNGGPLSDQSLTQSSAMEFGTTAPLLLGS